MLQRRRLRPRRERHHVVGGSSFRGWEGGLKAPRYAVPPETPSQSPDGSSGLLATILIQGSEPAPPNFWIPSSMTLLAARSSSDTQARRQTVGVPREKAALVSKGFEIGLRAWNACAKADRAGRMAILTKKLHDEFRTLGTKQRWMPFIQAVAKEYRKRRKLASSPLRFKSEARLSTIPCCGPLKGLLSLAEGPVVHGRLRREFHGFTLRFTAIKKKRYYDIRPLQARCPRYSQFGDVGMAATPDGLQIVERRWNGKVYEVLIPAKALMEKAAPELILTHVLRDRSRAVSLDTSLWGSLSGDMQEATRRLHRWCRARKAVGAIAYRKFESLGDSNRKAADHFKASGLFTTRQIKKMASEACEDCPNCGTPVLLRIDPKSGAISSPETSTCTCGTQHDLGRILATSVLSRGAYKRNFNYAAAR